ncbi:MAG: hypothetical protein J3K34DRAFT_505894 [Monoraphidium minutum]|nr:MAG: hypothetical protein J3K34DRAFT_505894 [Monoraphidium minutum]
MREKPKAALDQLTGVLRKRQGQLQWLQQENVRLLRRAAALEALAAAAAEVILALAVATSGTCNPAVAAAAAAAAAAEAGAAAAAGAAPLALPGGDGGGGGGGGGGAQQLSTAAMAAAADAAVAAAIKQVVAERRAERGAAGNAGAAGAGASGGSGQQAPHEEAQQQRPGGDRQAAEVPPEGGGASAAALVGAGQRVLGDPREAGSPGAAPQHEEQEQQQQPPPQPPNSTPAAAPPAGDGAAAMDVDAGGGEGAAHAAVSPSKGQGLEQQEQQQQAQQGQGGKVDGLQGRNHYTHNHLSSQPAHNHHVRSPAAGAARRHAAPPLALLCLPRVVQLSATVHSLLRASGCAFGGAGAAAARSAEFARPPGGMSPLALVLNATNIAAALELTPKSALEAYTAFVMEVLLLQTLLDRDFDISSLDGQLLGIMEANLGWICAAWVWNPHPVAALTTCHLLTGARDAAPPASHWVKCIRVVQPSGQQLTYLGEVRRVVRSQQAALSRAWVRLAAKLAAAAAGGHYGGMAEALAGLESVLRRWDVISVVQSVAWVGAMTPEQMARLCVRAFPYAPSSDAVMEHMLVAADLVAEKAAGGAAAAAAAAAAAQADAEAEAAAVLVAARGGA